MSGMWFEYRLTYYWLPTFDPDFPAPWDDRGRHVFGEATLSIFYLCTLHPQGIRDLAMEEILIYMGLKYK